MFSFHYSDLRAYNICPKLFWHKQHADRPAFFAFMQMQMALKDVLIEKLQLTHYALGERGMDAQLSLDLIQKNEWVINARFEYGDLRIKVPALHKQEEGYELYFSSMSLYPKIEDRTYFSTVLWVLKENGIKIIKIHEMYFNKDYIREENLDINLCFNLSTRFLKASGFDQGDILEVCLKKEIHPENNLHQMRALIYVDEFNLELDECPLGQRCTFFKECFPSFKEDPLSISQKLLDRYNYPENSHTPISRSDYAQLQAYLNKERFVDHMALANWLKTHAAPTISFVDFEWDSYGIPPFEKMKPFDVLPFQYSLHILKGDELLHKEFLGDGDTRLDFIQQLLADVPKEGPIIAYNAFGAEVLRLQELALQFPQYKEEIAQLIPRFVDLASLFVGGVIYDEKMEGQFSLKQIVKVIDPDLSYEDLAISHGMEAVKHYRSMQDEESDEIIREALLTYCQMDTYAMVKIYEWVRELHKEENYA